MQNSGEDFCPNRIGFKREMVGDDLETANTDNFTDKGRESWDKRQPKKWDKSI